MEETDAPATLFVGKVCDRCKEYKPYDKFCKYKSFPLDYSSVCYECDKELSRECVEKYATLQAQLKTKKMNKDTSNKNTTTNTTTPATMRKCRCCGKLLPLDAVHFRKNKHCRGGFSPRCKKCTDQAIKDRKETIALKSSSRDFSLSALTDDALCMELKRRGFAGKIVKTISVAV